MKVSQKLFFMIIIIFSFLFSSCAKKDYYVDNTPPTPPTNIRTVDGDNRVDIYWDRSPESDVAGYNVYYSYSYNGKYTLIGNTQNDYFVDYDAKNGVTYYYAVTAYDYNENESALSKDVVYDTPRPEGFNQSIFDYRKFPDNSGYSFADYSVVPYNDSTADFFFENFNGTYYLDVWEDTDIQDMGKTTDIYDVSTAPDSGWVPLKPNENIKYTYAIVGHTYIIWTWNNHFAKIRISQITPQRIVFDWAYQLVKGNKQLKINVLKKRRKFLRVINNR